MCWRPIIQMQQCYAVQLPHVSSYVHTPITHSLLDSFWTHFASPPWLPDGCSHIFRLYGSGPLSLKDYGSTTLRCKIWSLPSGNLVHISHVLLRVGSPLRPQLDRGGDELLLAEGRSVEGVTLGLELRRVPGTPFIDVVGSLTTYRLDMECNCDNFLKNLVVEMKRDLIEHLHSSILAPSWSI